jgi:hypothetical protein
LNHIIEFFRLATRNAVIRFFVESSQRCNT